MRNKIIVVIVTLVFIIGYFSIYIYKFQKYEKKEEKNISLIESINYSSDIEKRFILANLLKDDNEIVITEDNIDNTEKIINRANLKNGILVINKAQEKIKEIFNVVTEYTCEIDEKGYLKKIQKEDKKNDLSEEINNIIDSNICLIIDVNTTYKGLIKSMQLDMMVDHDAYVELIEYNKDIKIAIINENKINEFPEELTKKEVYEEIVLEILEKL